MIDEKDNLYDLTLLHDMSGGEKEFETEMIEFFVSNAPIAIEKMKKHYEEQNWIELRHVAHKFLSNVNMMGLDIISKEVDIVEDYALNVENTEEIPGLLKHIERYGMLAIEQLKKLIN